MTRNYCIVQQPVIIANWNAPSGNVSLAPFGGVGRIMKLGFQTVNLSVQACGNVKKTPDTLASPSWQLRFQIGFRYPKKPRGNYAHWS
jgi:hypothetical protein